MQDDFDGTTYEPARDHDRLAAQWLAVFNLMRDAEWRTLDQIAHETGYPEASISARLRDFRKDKFGGHTVTRRYFGFGLFEYQLIVRTNAADRSGADAVPGVCGAEPEGERTV